nr:retrovirus-related Pol polyprotein from transposon TNT 1-94 [Tanacetum cinerariifolium]
KFPTGNIKFSTADMGNKGKAIKASACWFWKPSQNLSNKGPNSNSVSMMFKKYTYIDTQGRLNGYSRHMTGNISYLSDYEPFDGGYVSFGQGGCKITGKGTIKTECIVLGRDFKLFDEANVLLRTPRQHNMYSINLNNIVPHKDFTCLVAKAYADEEGYLPNVLKITILALLVSKGSTKSVLFTWTFFLKTKDETSGILRKFITKIENLKDLKVKIIRCDNEGEFRNKKMDDFCSHKGIKREFSNARTPQQNGVAERRNKTLIEAATTILADAKLPVIFWAEAVNTACYVQNRVLVNKSHNKIPYELFNGKFEAKGDEGTNSTNLSGTKDATSQEVKKDVSSLRYIALPNWVHDALLESSSSKPQDDYSTDVPESSKNLNPTATSTNPPADQMETLTMETLILTVSLPIPTACFTNSQEPSKPKKNSDALQDLSWVEDMQEELLQFKIQNIWTLVDCPKKVRPIRTKWVLKNMKDERGIVIRNKARLVAQGHTQEEGINYDEVFAPVTRVEAIRLFLAYASFMGFTVYQMDVKSTFLYDTIDEEVYVMQPFRFQDPGYPTRVYKVEKAMYGLHQAPRAWYGTLSKYLLTNSFQKGTIDQTLFIISQRGDFILVQVYVDDIIFGSLNPHLCREFEALMHEKIQMSAMGELNFFLGLQVLQKKDGIFLSQDKHQVTPKECHLHAVKRIFRYLKGHPKLGLWYPKESPFDLVAYSDSDYGGATQDRKSTTEGCQFLGRRLISWQFKK